jgi:transposase-like protein
MLTAQIGGVVTRISKHLRSIPISEIRCMIKLLGLMGRPWSGLLLERQEFSNEPFCPTCPNCGKKGQKHRPHPLRVYDYRCSGCGKIFNCWTGTVFQGTHRKPSELATLLYGFSLRLPASQFPKSLGWHESSLTKQLLRLEQAGWVAKLRDAGNLHGIGVDDIAKEISTGIRSKYRRAFRDLPERLDFGRRARHAATCRWRKRQSRRKPVAPGQ